MGRVTGTTIFTSDGKRNVELEEKFSAILGAKEGEYFYADKDGTVEKTHIIYLVYIVHFLFFFAYVVCLIYCGPLTSGRPCETSDGHYGLHHHSGKCERLHDGPTIQRDKLSLYKKLGCDSCEALYVCDFCASLMKTFN